MEWKEVRLGNVSEIITGYPFKGNKYANEGIRVVRGDNITIGTLRWDSKEKRWNEPFNKADYYSLKENDIVIGMDGSRVGRNKAKIHKEDLPLLLAQRVACIRHNEKSDQDYLYYQIFSNNFLNYVETIKTGSAIPHISLKQIQDYPITLPTRVADQHRIASILSSLDSKIEMNITINAKLEEMAQALFKKWFVNYEPFKDKGMVESELGMIPKGWKVGKLEDLGDIVGGSTPSKKNPEYYTENGIAWITPKDLSIHNNKFTSKGEIDITEAGYKSTSTKLMPRGTVLFSSRAPIGYISIAKNEICTNQGFKSIVPNYAGTAYLYCLLKKLTPSIECKATGSTFKEVSGSFMKSLSVIIPPKEVIDEYEMIIESIFEIQENNEEESLRLSQIRDTLLPKLMSGEIEI